MFFVKITIVIALIKRESGFGPIVTRKGRNKKGKGKKEATPVPNHFVLLTSVAICNSKELSVKFFLFQLFLQADQHMVQTTYVFH